MVKACNEHFECLIKDLHGQSVFSYTFYCSSGCRNIGIAACTREGLRRRNMLANNVNEPLWYGEVNAAEWDYVNINYSLFDEVDEYIEVIYEFFYDGELEDIDLDNLDDNQLWEVISNFFISVLVDSFNILKAKLNENCFEDDLLAGIQFGDPDKYAIDMVEKISSILNSESWHNKILLNNKAITKSR